MINSLNPFAVFRRNRACVAQWGHQVPPGAMRWHFYLWLARNAWVQWITAGCLVQESVRVIPLVMGGALFFCLAMYWVVPDKWHKYPEIKDFLRHGHPLEERVWSNVINLLYIAVIYFVFGDYGLFITLGLGLAFMVFCAMMVDIAVYPAHQKLWEERQHKPSAKVINLR
jgi:hypothetical protein